MTVVRSEWKDFRRSPVRLCTKSSFLVDATWYRYWNLVFMSSSYEKVRGSKLTFKGGLGIDSKISKKTKKKKKQPQPQPQKSELVEETEDASKSTDIIEIDTGTGHAPDGKKSKKYEELFPVETRKHGYVVPSVDSRSAALDERIKKKADRYCK